MVTLPKTNNAFTGGGRISTDNTLHLSATVTDQAIRDLGIRHDGYEVVDAFIPSPGGADWQPVRLNYETEVAVGGNPPRDLYDMHLQLSEEQANAVRTAGVAFRITTRTGETLWAQSPGQNTRVHDER